MAILKKAASSSPKTSASTFEAVNHADDATYDYGTHCSDDDASNLQTLVQEIQELHAGDQGYKRIDYVRGYINAIYYRKGKSNQFTHRYEYDEDNRPVNSVTTGIPRTPGFPIFR